MDLHTPGGVLRAVDDVSFTVHKGRTLALLGESGCGKSLTAQSIVGLLDPVAEVTGGSVHVGDTNVLRWTGPAGGRSPGRSWRSCSRTR